MANQTEIAIKAKISQPYLSEILNGKKRPTYKTAKRIARATCTDPELWLEGTPEQIKSKIMEMSCD